MKVKTCGDCPCYYETHEGLQGGLNYCTQGGYPAHSDKAPPENCPLRLWGNITIKLDES